MPTFKYYKYLCRKYIIDKFCPKETYSQIKEDLVIQALLGKVNSFIDIGANDGISFSNSYLFAQKGARGLCFEPLKFSYWKLALYYFLNPRVICINEAISEKEAMAEMCVYGWEGLLSYIEKGGQKRDLSAGLEIVKVITRRLSYWLEKYPGFQTVDFITIDTEGHEIEVLKGINFSIFKAKCFVIETDKIGIENIDNYLSKEYYKLALTNGLNTFWIAKDLYSNEQLKNICAKFQGYKIVG